jgi:putative peptide zinc metalloprotease protein
LRWKVLVTRGELTRRLTAPFTFLFRPWIMWPIVAAFGAVFWFVLIERGLASAITQAFHSPGMLLLIFALTVASAGFHELGHAAACRYGGATPGGMGMGLYLAWPAFYTDVTDAYRLPRRDRLRVDLAGLYFNAVVADLTMVAWLFWRADALLLLVAVQILQMVKQLSPIIRADGYHILSDATGMPDLYSHMGPTLRRLVPGRRREPSALTGWARFLVTAWVLVIVPVLLSLMVGAVVLLPRLAATAWASGQQVAALLPHEVASFQVVNLLATLLRLLALIVPVAASALVTQKILRKALAKARAWSAGHPGRRAGLKLLGASLVALAAWAWWPSGQYKPLQPHGGTIPGLIQTAMPPPAHLASVRRPAALVPGGHRMLRSGAQLAMGPGVHLAEAMIPVTGPSQRDPALFLVPGSQGRPPTAFVAFGGGTPADPTEATTFPFTLTAPPGPDGTQALAVGTRDGGVTYDVAYALIKVTRGAPVKETNSAFALAHCHSCTTVAVSFQVVLVIGQSKDIAPIDGAGALNYHCPSCTTVAIADQIVVTLRSEPSQTLVAQLESALRRLNALPALGAAATPAAIAGQVASVEGQVDAALNSSGLLPAPLPSDSATNATSSGTSTGSSAAPVSTGASASGGSQSGTSATSVTPAATPSTTGAASTSAASSTTTSTTGAPTTSTSGTTSPTTTGTTTSTGGTTTTTTTP